jgi:hypothetical protein
MRPPAPQVWLQPLAESQIGGDDHRRMLVEPTDQMEEKLTARLGKGQLAEFVEDNKVHALEIIRHHRAQHPSA